MFPSVLINTYARRVKTPKYSRVFWVPLSLGASTISIDQAAPPQHFGPVEAGFQNLWIFLFWSFL